MWRRIEEHGGLTRIEYTPLTGRTHQLRVHSSHPLGLDAAIVGDRLYGSGKRGETLLLHASFLACGHPEDDRLIEFHSTPRF